MIEIKQEGSQEQTDQTFSTFTLVHQRLFRQQTVPLNSHLKRAQPISGFHKVSSWWCIATGSGPPVLANCFVRLLVYFFYSHPFPLFPFPFLLDNVLPKARQILRSTDLRLMQYKWWKFVKDKRVIYGNFDSSTVCLSSTVEVPLYSQRSSSITTLHPPSTTSSAPSLSLSLSSLSVSLSPSLTTLSFSPFRHQSPSGFRSQHYLLSEKPRQLWQNVIQSFTKSTQEIILHTNHARRYL